MWASQAAIYQRYGFAPAGLNRGYAIDTADIALLETAADAETEVSRYRPEGVLDSLREVYKQFIAQRTGYLHRGKSLWLNSVLDGSENAQAVPAGRHRMDRSMLHWSDLLKLQQAMLFTPSVLGGWPTRAAARDKSAGYGLAGYVCLLRYLAFLRETRSRG